MKKKLLAVAVVGALASPAAFAQVLYGIVDIGYQNAKYSDADTNKNFIQSGQATGSRLGVRGSEDLAGGTYVMYQYELETNMDDGDPFGAPARIAIGGIGSKAWGELTIGRQYTHAFNTFAVGSPGPFTYGTFASFYGNTGINTRGTNSVKYSSPVMGGFSVGALWAPGETTTPGTASNGNYMDAAVRYTPGPFGVALSWARATAEAGGVDNDTDQMQITANWDNRAFGIYVGYIQAENDGVGGAPATVDSNAWWINPIVRFGGRNAVTFLWGQGENEAVADGEGTVWGVSFVHTMSKRTSVYAGYGRADNDPGAALKPTGLAGTVTVDDPSGFQIGLVHSF